MPAGSKQTLQKDFASNQDRKAALHVGMEKHSRTRSAEGKPQFFVNSLRMVSWDEASPGLAAALMCWRMLGQVPEVLNAPLITSDVNVKARWDIAVS